ncbi:MAG: hypothetical protein WC365_04630 [Candidatus Babeliales bacterium]
MKFLRTLVALAALCISTSLFAQIELTQTQLETIGIKNGARLRIKDASGSESSWVWSQYQEDTKQHYFSMTINPQKAWYVGGFNNLGSIFIVQGQGNTVALRVNVSGAGGYGSTSFLDKFVSKPTYSTSAVYYKVLAQSVPSAGVGNYLLAFQDTNGTYLNGTIRASASSTPQWFTVEILDSQRNDSYRGSILNYENATYQIYIAGTPLNAWIYSDNANPTSKQIIVGLRTFVTGEQDERLSSDASAMVILNAEDQNSKSFGALKYGDKVRIIGLHTVTSTNSDPTAVNTYNEAYIWTTAADASYTKVGTVVGSVEQIGSSFQVATNSNKKSTFIITSAIDPSTSKALYPEGSPVYEKDAIRLIPYWLVGSDTYPYTQHENLFFWLNWSGREYSGVVFNPDDTNKLFDKFNLISLKKRGGIPTKTPTTQRNFIEKAWSDSANALQDLTNDKATAANTSIASAKTYAAIKNIINDVLAYSPSSTNFTALGTTLLTAFNKAITLVQPTNYQELKTLITNAATQSKYGQNFAIQLAAIDNKINLGSNTDKLKAVTSNKNFDQIVTALGLVVGTPTTDGTLKTNLNRAVLAALKAALGLVTTSAQASTLARIIITAKKNTAISASDLTKISTEVGYVTQFYDSSINFDKLNSAIVAALKKAPLTTNFANHVYKALGKLITLIPSAVVKSTATTRTASTANKQAAAARAKALTSIKTTFATARSTSFMATFKANINALSTQLPRN